MQIENLKPFKDVPFYFWAKDENGKYLWADDAVSEMAGENVVGKTDQELIWAEDAPPFQKNDQTALSTGKPLFVHEQALHTSKGKIKLSTCKWPGELDGKKCCFGVSFVLA